MFLLKNQFVGIPEEFFKRQSGAILAVNFGEGRGESGPGLVEVDIFFCETLNEKVSVHLDLERIMNHMDHLVQARRQDGKT